MPNEKACTKCGEVKALDEYHRDKKLKDGRANRCKNCRKKDTKKYYEKNKDKIVKRSKAWREANADKIRERKSLWYKENKEKKLEADRRYREENREKVRESKQRYYADAENRAHKASQDRQYQHRNREKLREYYRSYYEENKDYRLEDSRKRNIQYREATGSFRTKPRAAPWTADEDAILLADDGRTVYQKAIALGRTYGSVTGRIQRLRKSQNL